jgi:hypothetical protein
MSRDVPKISEAVETLRNRTNITGVDVALKDLESLAPSWTHLDRARLFEPLLQIALTGKVGPDALKSATLERCVRSIAWSAPVVTTEQLLNQFNEDFFTVVSKHPPSDESVQIALLELYSELCRAARGNLVLHRKLAACRIDDILVPTLNEFIKNPASFGSRHVKGAEAMSRALLAYTWVSKKANLRCLDNVDLFRFVKRELDELSGARDAAEVQQIALNACAAAANLIVTWSRVGSLSEEDRALSERSALEALKEHLVSSIEQLHAKDAKPAAGALLLEMLRLAKNWCYRSQRVSNMLCKLGVHKAIIEMLASKVCDDKVMILACLGLMRNMMRKQPSDFLGQDAVDVHAEMLKQPFAAALLDLYQAYPSDHAMIASVLGCVLNGLSSNHSRALLLDFEPLAMNQLQTAKCQPDIAEVCLGIAWGLNSRNRFRSESEVAEWFTVICKALIKFQDHPGCLRRGVGALIVVLLAQPTTKICFGEKNVQVLKQLREGTKTDIIHDIDAVLFLALDSNS